jgi:hypothetical protein
MSAVRVEQVARDMVGNEWGTTRRKLAGFIEHKYRRLRYHRSRGSRRQSEHQVENEEEKVSGMRGQKSVFILDKTIWRIYVVQVR